MSYSCDEPCSLPCPADVTVPSEPAAGDVVLAGPALDALAINGATAVFIGRSTLQGVQGYTFRVVATGGSW